MSAKDDFEKYCKYMRTGNVDGCIAIEKKYGLYGLSPEEVTTALHELMQFDDFIKEG